jgi:microcystin degradation protein MlrC
MPRVVLAGIFHETHSFVSEVTGLGDFRIERGDEILGRRGDASQIDGFIEVADRLGWEIVPAANYSAMPSGVVEDHVFESFWQDTEAAVAGALKKGVDAVFLSLHGAMSTQSIEDVEGEFLARLRAVRGFGALPIFGVFDLHATFTEPMARLADALLCYRQNPHVDARDSAVRAAGLLARSLATGSVPYMLRRSVPILWPPTGTGTADSPMRDLERLARELETENPSIWAINVVAGYAYADAYDAGVSFSAVVDGSDDIPRAALDRLADAAEALKDRGLIAEPSVDDVLSNILPIAGGPVLLVEPSDNIGGGAPGDGTGVLRALLRHGVDHSVVVINDPEAVTALATARPGDVRRLSIGGKGSPLDEGPVVLDVLFNSRSGGRFTLEDSKSHMAAWQGLTVDMGPSAVVQHRGLTILLTSRKTPPFDLGQLRSQGIEPSKMAVIGVKAAVAHRRAYDPVAKASYTVGTSGPCAGNPASLPYRRLRRPIFPLD